MSITKFGKKILGLIAVIAFAFTLVACGGDGTTSDKDTKKADATSQINEVYKTLLLLDSSAMVNVQNDIPGVKTNTKYDNVTVAWESSLPDVISTEGKVTRPEYDDERAVRRNEILSVEVTLTATITAAYTYTENEEEKSDTIVRTKEYVFTVQCLPEPFIGNIKEVKDAAYKYIYEDKKVALDNSVTVNSTVFSVKFYGVVTATLSASGAGQFMVHDGTDGIYVYSNKTAVNIGDTVLVCGDIYSYFGNLQVGSNIAVTVVEPQAGVEAGDYETITVDEWEKNYVLGRFGGQLYSIYCKLETGSNAGGSDKYKLVDPYTGKVAWIYYKSYSTEAENTLKDLVGEHVNIQGVSYDRDSRFNQNHLIWNGVIEQAEAPTDLTDEQKVDVTIAGLELPAEVGESFTLPASATWTVKSGEGITISGTAATVTKADEIQEVVLTATVTVGAVVKTKDFAIKVLSKVIPYLNPGEAATALADKENDKATVYVKGYIAEGSKLDKYGNFVLEGFDGKTVAIYGGFGKDADGEYVFPSLITEKGLAVGVCVGVRGTYGYSYKNITGLEIVEVFPEEKILTPTEAAAALIVEANDGKTVIIKGVVAEGSKLDKYGNFVLVDEAGGTVTIYGGFGKDAAGEYVFPGLITSMGIEIGGTVVVQGIYGFGYKNVTGKVMLAATPKPEDTEPVVAGDLPGSTSFIGTAKGVTALPEGWTGAPASKGTYDSPFWQSFRSDGDHIISPLFKDQTSVDVKMTIYLNNKGTSAGMSSKLQFDALDKDGVVLGSWTTDELNNNTTGYSNPFDIEHTFAFDGIAQIKITFVKDGGGNVGFSTVIIVATPAE